MINKKSLILHLFTLHLVTSLKPIDFCVLKHQECKGFYDRQHNYHTKCELMKCNGSFKNDCGFNICSKNENACIHYFYYYTKLALTTPAVDAFLALKDFEKQNKFHLFNERIPVCKNNIYGFESKDFCSNEGNCFMINNYFKGLGKITNKIDCKCPSKRSFKCGKYCATNSIACDFIKSNNIKNKINDCDNQNVTYSYSRYY